MALQRGLGEDCRAVGGGGMGAGLQRAPCCELQQPGNSQSHFHLLQLFTTSSLSLLPGDYKKCAAQPSEAAKSCLHVGADCPFSSSSSSYSLSTPTMIIRRSWLSLPPAGRRNPRHLTITIPLVFLFIWLLLPYDSTIRLALRFNLNRLSDALSSQSESWVSAPPLFPVDLSRDVVVLVKTGYGTRKRLGAWFDALSPKSELSDRNMLVVADYSHLVAGGGIIYKSKGIGVVDVVNRTLEDLGLPLESSHPRISQYRSLTQAITAQDEEKAMKLSKDHGWMLDSMKVS